MRKGWKSEETCKNLQWQLPVGLFFPQQMLPLKHSRYESYRNIGGIATSKFNVRTLAGAFGHVAFGMVTSKCSAGMCKQFSNCDERPRPEEMVIDSSGLAT